MEIQLGFPGRNFVTKRRHPPSIRAPVLWKPLPDELRHLSLLSLFILQVIEKQTRGGNSQWNHFCCGSECLCDCAGPCWCCPDSLNTHSKRLFPRPQINLWGSALKDRCSKALKKIPRNRRHYVCVSVWCYCMNSNNSRAASRGCSDKTKPTANTAETL